MGYSTVTEVRIALANALSRGNPSTSGPQSITSIGNSLTSTVTTSDIYQYIRWADMYIDSVLSSVYETPLERVNEGSFNLAMDVTAGDGTTTLTALVLEDNSRFTEEDVILIRDSSNYQQLIIASIIDQNRLTVTLPVTASYLATSARIERIRYPDPIPLISAKIAAATFYDKAFAAQVDGNKSEFGDKLRGEANDNLNQVLAGTIMLKIADANKLSGRRYLNPALEDVFPTRAEAGKSWVKGSQ